MARTDFFPAAALFPFVPLPEPVVFFLDLPPLPELFAAEGDFVTTAGFFLCAGVVVDVCASPAPLQNGMTIVSRAQAAARVRTVPQPLNFALSLSQPTLPL